MRQSASSEKEPARWSRPDLDLLRPEPAASLRRLSLSYPRPPSIPKLGGRCKSLLFLLGRWSTASGSRRVFDRAHGIRRVAGGLRELERVVGRLGVGGLVDQFFNFLRSCRSSGSISNVTVVDTSGARGSAYGAGVVPRIRLRCRAQLKTASSMRSRVRSFSFLSRQGLSAVVSSRRPRL